MTLGLSLSTDKAEGSRISLSSGRIELYATVFRMGPDLLVSLEGGKSHIGAIALADAGQTEVIELDSHRDDLPARILAAVVGHALNRHVAVAAGIHYDDITGAEIETVLGLTRLLAHEIVKLCRNGGKMLTIAEIDGFINYMRSGQLEEKFKCSGEVGRGEILELMERLMDAADLADEIATRLIFRGSK